jgi:murein DD-endopeptidase MepM/ murein hydrolase activator NlpD
MPFRPRAALACATLALVAGCGVEWRSGSGSDSAGATAGETASATAAAPGDDSLRALGDATPRMAAGTDRAAGAGMGTAGRDDGRDSTGAAGAADGDAPVATPDELAALSAGLVVPVAGIRVDALPDNFHEMRGSRPHDALDILAPRGTPVLSAADGRLLALHDSQRGGLMVYASDPSGRFVLLYGHLDAYAPGLAEGMALVRGQPLGTVGTSGNAAPGTPHLHFGIARVSDTREWWRGVAVDPRPLLLRSLAAR